MAITVREHPRTSTIINDFLVVDCPLAINEIIGRSLLKALKAVTLIYHVTMKFPTTEGTGKVRGCQYDSRECYNKSLKTVDKDNMLPRMEVGKIIAGSSKNTT